MLILQKSLIFLRILEIRLNERFHGIFFEIDITGSQNRVLGFSWIIGKITNTIVLDLS